MYVHGFEFEVTKTQKEAWDWYVSQGYKQDGLDNTMKSRFNRITNKYPFLRTYDPANPQPFIEACIKAKIPVDPSASSSGNGASVFVKPDPDVDPRLANTAIALYHLEGLRGGDDDGLDPDALGMAGARSAGHTPRQSTSLLQLAVDFEALAADYSNTFYSTSAAGGQANAGAAGGQADAGAAGGQANAGASVAVQADALVPAGAAGGQANAGASVAVQADALVPAVAAGGQANAGAAGGQADAGAAVAVQADAPVATVVPVPDAVVAISTAASAAAVYDADDWAYMDAEITRLRQEVGQFAASTREWFGKCKEKDKIIEDLKSKLDVLQHQHDKRGVRLEQKHDRVTELEAIVKEKDETIETLRSNIITINLRHRAELEKQQPGTATTNPSENITKLQEERDFANQARDVAVGAVETLRVQLKELTSEAKKKDAFVLQLEQEKQELVLANKTSEARITKLTTANEALKTRITGYVTENQALEVRVTELTKEKDQSDSEALEGGKQNYLLRIQIGQMTAQINALTKERDELQVALEEVRKTSELKDISGYLTNGFQRVQNTLTEQHGFVRKQLDNIVAMQSDVLAPGIRNQHILVQDFVQAVAGTATELAHGQAQMMSQLDDIKLATGSKPRIQQLEISSVDTRTLPVDHKTDASGRSFDPSLYTDPFSARPRSATQFTALSVASSVTSSVSSFGHSDRRLVSRYEKDEYYRKDTEAVKQRQKDIWKNW